VPADALLPIAFRQAKKLAALPPASLRATKRLLKAETAEGVAQRIREEMKIFRELLVSPEAREIFEAFFQKQR
jgi:enoyl-CoA hydratase/carnithine racemase